MCVSPEASSFRKTTKERERNLFFAQKHGAKHKSDTHAHRAKGESGGRGGGGLEVS